jgi:hypothetical protein
MQGVSRLNRQALKPAGALKDEDAFLEQNHRSTGVKPVGA